MSDSQTVGDGAWPVQVTRTAVDGVDQCQLESDERLSQLDKLMPRIRDQAERLYMCRRSMSLSDAANSGDHPDALVLETTLVELAAYGASSRI